MCVIVLISVEYWSFNIDKNYNQFINSQKQYKKIDSKRKIKNSDKVYVNITTNDESVPDFFESQNGIWLLTRLGRVEKSMEKHEENKRKRLQNHCRRTGIALKIS